MNRIILSACLVGSFSAFAIDAKIECAEVPQYEPGVVDTGSHDEASFQELDPVLVTFNEVQGSFGDNRQCFDKLSEGGMPMMAFAAGSGFCYYGNSHATDRTVMWVCRNREVKSQ